MRKFFVFLILLALPFASVSAGDDDRPWTFWYWMYGALSKPAIRADLLAMKQVGLGGCYLMPIRGVNDRPEYGGDGQQLSPKFWEYVDEAFLQADSLGLDMGIHICDGFALAGSPAITPAESMQKVVWTDTVVTVGTKPIVLRRPEAYQGFYGEIAAFAFPCRLSVERFSVLRGLRKPVLDGDMTIAANGTCTASKGGTITFDCGDVKTIRSLQIIPSGNNIQSQRLMVLASTDGVSFRQVRQLQPVRQGWQSSGPAFTYSLPRTTARYFRFQWSPAGTEPGSEDLDAAKWKPTLKLRDIVLSTDPRIDQWEGKTAQAWRVSGPTVAADIPDADCVSPDQLIRLRLRGDTVQNAFPRSQRGQQFRILRFGHTSTGQMNATAGGGKGLEVDKFNPQAVDKLLDNWFRLFLARPHADVVKVLHVDSWECGCQNWGHGFSEAFRARRGYAIEPFMPLYAGLPVGSVDQSERVMRDIRLTINELVNERFFAHAEAKGHEWGRRVSQESIAPTFVADGIEHYRYSDLPMGEYWLNSPTHDKPNDMLDAISGAHLYGKPIVQAEGFTEVRGDWQETPAMLKSLLDRHLALGMNKLVFHVNTHNPWMDRKPGMTLDGIGLYFQRDNTWYPEASGMVGYVTRCQHLLQLGQPVVDVAVFTGEEMPSRALTPDRLVDILPGLFGDARIESERSRMANADLPMTENPVGVFHAAGIVDLKDWVNALHGYQYDSMNPDALLRAAKVVDGHLQMPAGNRYKVLVLPGRTKMDPAFKDYSEAVKAKIEECRKAGVIIVNQPYSAADFADSGLPRDVELPEGVAYTHRTTDSAEIYLIANQQAEARTIRASFRISGRVPYLYDALQDVSHRAEWTVQNGRTELSLNLDANGSVFVLFPREARKNLPVLKDAGFRQPVTGKWTLRFATTGETVETSRLDSWTTREPRSQRFYSGSVDYVTDFSYKPKGRGRVMVDLGTVCDLAHVYVNGIDCGIAWTPPYAVDVTKALRRGKNTLRIVVTNTWANALLGADSGEPPFAGIWTNAKYRMKQKRLLPAGLLGPVLIKE
ncbi:MAG: DNA-binding protein [Prevotella sp.]|nr:DNA-binding protein [Prevotella sp.]